MRGKSQVRHSVWFTSTLMAAIALMVVLAAVPAWAQNPVPPTAREAAALPQYATKLHPATLPAMNKPRPATWGRSTPENRQSCSDGSSQPQCGDWEYSNGPVNGNDGAYDISSPGSVVSDSFAVTSGGFNYVGWFHFYIWKNPGDVLSSVQWSITGAPNGGTVYASGTASGYQLADDFISTNQYGYDIDIVSVNPGSASTGSTAWLNLFNASTLSGYGVGWDVNSGPSQAYASGYGQIPSEAFDIGFGSGDPPPCFQAGGNLQVIHDFTAQEIGATGLINDKAGNLYGTIVSGGANGAGLAYELSNKGQNWILDPLYSFPGGSNGHAPSSPILGPEGALYGTANGGLLDCYGGIDYCGLVYSLKPAPTACLTSLCSWMENTLYQFTDGDGLHPMSVAAFDQEGNLYGFSGIGGGANGWGSIFELTPSPGGWTEKILYNFTSNDAFPTSLLVGNDGSLYGTTTNQWWGNDNHGVVFQLVPSGSSWTKTVIYDFNGKGRDGPDHLIQDSLGNLYGVAGREDQYGDGHWFVVFKLSPSNGGWAFSQLYQSQAWSFATTAGTSGLAIDAAGNLYLAITDYCSGQPGSGCEGRDSSWGLIVMVSPDGNSSNLWYSHGVDFAASGPLALDASGNLYGTTGDCGKNGYGTAWKVTH